MSGILNNLIIILHELQSKQILEQKHPYQTGFQSNKCSNAIPI